MTELRNRGTEELRYSYRNLVLWKDAQAFAQAVVEVVDELPARRSVDSIARQIVRSATSIAANIAEGHGRFSIPSYRNHLSIAKASACETDSWLDMLRRLGYLSADRERDLHLQCSALIRSLTGKINQLQRSEGSYVREEPAVYQAFGEYGDYAFDTD